MAVSASVSTLFHYETFKSKATIKEVEILNIDRLIENCINGKKLKLNHYVLEPNYEKAKKHFQQLHDQLRVYEEKFGEYPWYRDGF